MVYSIYEESNGKNKVEMGEEGAEATAALRAFLFDRVYNDKTFRDEEKKADRMISALYEYYSERPEELPEFYREELKTFDKDTVLCDYISGMSDMYAVKTFSEIFIPDNWKL